MTGQAHWIDLVPILVGAIGIAILLIRDVYAERRFRIEEKRFLCPTLRRKVIARLVRFASSGKVVGVRRCSGLSAPDLVTCGKDCVPGFGPRTSPTTLSVRGPIENGAAAH